MCWRKTCWYEAVAGFYQQTVVRCVKSAPTHQVKSSDTLARRGLVPEDDPFHSFSMGRCSMFLNLWRRGVNRRRHERQCHHRRLALEKLEDRCLLSGGIMEYDS